MNVWAFSSYAGVNQIGSGNYSRITTDGVDTPAGQTAAGIAIEHSRGSANNRPIQLQVLESLQAGIHRISNDGGTEDSSGDAEYRTLFAITMDLADPVGERGQTGVQGLTGIAGITGAQPTGIKGITGSQGATEVQGLTGFSPTGASPTGAQPTGVQGVTGVQGITGASPTGRQPITGVKGLTGAQGVAGASPTGASPTGRQGITGTKGLTGVQGVVGEQPTGAQPTGVQGITGTLGLTGVQGVTGANGPTGAQPTGALGPPGVKGQTGVMGLTGFSPTGASPTGVKGITGVDGITGAQGLTGVQGLTGPGVNLEILDWNVTGGLTQGTVGSGVDGFAVMPRFGTIVEVVLSLGNQGSAGTTIVDLLRGTGTLSATPYAVQFGTIFTTAGNRPMIGAAASPNNKTRDTAAPNITAFKKGDVFGPSIAAVATRRRHEARDARPVDRGLARLFSVDNLAT